MKQVALAEIVFDAGTQVRESINEQVVADYAERLSEGVVFPAIVLFHDGNRYYLADGFHRVMAHGRNGIEQIAADVMAGTREDALWFALGANKANGQRLSSGDKKHAILLALKTWPDKSPNLIAEQVGCERSYVTKLKGVNCHTLPNRVTGKDGKSYPASYKLPPERIAEVEVRLRSGAGIMEISEAISMAPSTIRKIQAAAEIANPSLNRSRDAVEARRDKMHRMAEDGYTSRQIADAIGMSIEGCRKALRGYGISVPADSVTRGSHTHDSSRIVQHIVMDAENLTADVNLIDFSSLDRADVAAWVESLQASRKKLGAFIQRLLKETTNEAA